MNSKDRLIELRGRIATNPNYIKHSKGKRFMRKQKSIALLAFVLSFLIMTIIMMGRGQHP